MSSQFSIEDETADNEFIIIGGRSFEAIEQLLNASDPPCGPVQIIHSCEYIGWEDIEYPEVRYDGAVVADDAKKVIEVLSKVDPQMRIGGMHAADFVESFKELREWALAHPNHSFRPVFYQ